MRTLRAVRAVLGASTRFDGDQLAGLHAVGRVKHAVHSLCAIYEFRERGSVDGFYLVFFPVVSELGIHLPGRCQFGRFTRHVVISPGSGLNYLLAVALHTIIAIPFKPFYLPGILNPITPQWLDYARLAIFSFQIV
jgi:hypothetical protein